MNSNIPNNAVALQLEKAISWHQQGNLQNAFEMYQQVLSVEPNNFEALHRVGMLFWQVGRLDEALNFFMRASIVQPNNFDACYNQGITLHALKRYNEALLVFNRALLLNPVSAEVHYNRGLILTSLNQYEDALLSYQKAISFRPKYAEAYNNRGLILLERFKSYTESLISFNKAISINKDFAEAYYNRGLVLSELNKHEEALASYDKAISLKPDYCDAYNNRGILLKGFQRYGEALANFDKAISLRPNYANAHNNRGAVLEKLGRYDDAMTSFDKLIELFPGFADLHYNRGLLLAKMRRYDNALADYDRAISIDSNHADANYNRALLLAKMGRYVNALAGYDRAISIDSNHADANYNKALLSLMLGNFDEGWPLYEWRWKIDQLKDDVRFFNQPSWLGDGAITGKTLLVWAEQGLGDFIQFVRYVPMIEALGAKVILEVPETLVSLISTLNGSFTVIVKREALPDFDLHCPIMSLPLALRTTVNNIPAVTPYLKTDSDKQIKWQARLGNKVRPRIGLVWSGNVNHLNDCNRSIALRTLTPLLTLDVDFHSLQKEIRPDDMDVLSESSIVVHQDDLHDFSDTAALISELDMVITIDTSVAHLAGALGKPVWILLPHVPDFRWLLERNDSPWYPTARLFRQERVGGWDGVINRVLSDLKAQLLNN